MTLTPTYRTSGQRVALAVTGLMAVAATAAMVTPVGADATGRDPDLVRLQQDTDAIHALGVTGVQARLLGAHGRQLVATSGVADLTTNRPVPPNGYFRIASTAKPLVATVVLQLAGEGELSLDDTVERWLPGVVRGNGNDGHKITVRQLLQHTSGIHDDFPDYSTVQEYYQHRYDIYTPEQIVARAMRHQPDFPPGQGWGYSTTGYMLLDMIIERAAGRPWHDEVANRIIRPLGLHHTTWPGRSPTLPQPHARGYQLFPTGELVDVTEQIAAYPAGAILSTTRDINQFFRALLGGRLLRPEQLTELKQTIPISKDTEQIWPGGQYGLGLVRRPLSCGGSYWSHDGSDGGYFSVNGVTDDGRRSVVISMSTSLADSMNHMLQQQRAADTLINHALCGTV